MYDTPVRPSDLRAPNRKWDDAGIREDVGITKHSITSFVYHITTLNGERPVAQRKTNDEICEKILDAIADASSKFGEGAIDEFDKPMRSRRFEHGIGEPAGMAGLAYLTRLRLCNTMTASGRRHSITAPSRPCRRRACRNAAANVTVEGAFFVPTRRGAGPGFCVNGCYQSTKTPSKTLSTLCTRLGLTCVAIPRPLPTLTKWMRASWTWQ